MSTWFTSDTHFGHERILELESRPFASTAEMNEALIDNWNSVVRPNDFVYHMGDAVMGSFAENVQLLGRLNGFIYLIPGNHDRVSSVYHAKDAARDRFRQMYLDQGICIMREENITVIADKKVTLSHFPFADERFPEMCPVDNGQWLIHGHVHSEWQVNGRQINVGVDVWDYTPVPFDTVMDIIRQG